MKANIEALDNTGFTIDCPLGIYLVNCNISLIGSNNNCNINFGKFFDIDGGIVNIFSHKITNTIDNKPFKIYNGAFVNLNGCTLNVNTDTSPDETAVIIKKSTILAGIDTFVNDNKYFFWLSEFSVGYFPSFQYAESKVFRSPTSIAIKAGKFGFTE